MIVLLDTHSWLWMVASPARLGPAARALVEDAGTTLLLSAASSWEIAIKYRLGKLTLPEPPESFVPSRMLRDAVQPLSVKHSHALRVASLDEHHRDPFDRLLVAQCLVEDVPLLTADPLLAPYPIARIAANR